MKKKSFSFADFSREFIDFLLKKIVVEMNFGTFQSFEAISER